jgi:hypothetical protein
MIIHPLILLEIDHIVKITKNKEQSNQLEIQKDDMKRSNFVMKPNIES